MSRKNVKKEMEEYKNQADAFAKEKENDKSQDGVEIAVEDEDAKKEPDQPKEEALTPESKIEQLEKELEEQKGKYLRLHADFDNYRKRSYKEMMQARLESKIDSITPVLNVFDHFDMAMMAMNQAENVDAIRDGMNMILTEFQKALDDLGVEKINAVGKKFDPTIHEAIANEPSNEVEEEHVVKQWRSGYRIGERVIRPANVVVSSGPASADGDE